MAHTNVSDGDLQVTFKCGADLTAAQYKGVKLSANNTVVLAGAGDKTIGVLQVGSLTGGGASVRLSGYGPVLLGATAVAGDLLKTNADGEWIPAETNDDFYNAICVNGGADGEIVDAIILPLSSLSVTA